MGRVPLASIVRRSCDTVWVVSSFIRLALLLLLPGCLAVPPARAPQPKPQPPPSAPVPIPKRDPAPGYTSATQCPFFEGKGKSCSGGLGLVCTKDDKSCERCECKASPDSEAQTVEMPGLDPREK